METSKIGLQIEMETSKIRLQIEMLMNVLDVNIGIHKEDIKNHNGSAYLVTKEKVIANLEGQKEAYSNVLNWLK